MFANPDTLPVRVVYLSRSRTPSTMNTAQIRLIPTDIQMALGFCSLFLNWTKRIHSMIIAVSSMT